MLRTSIAGIILAGFTLLMPASSIADIITPDIENDFRRRLPVIEKAGNFNPGKLPLDRDRLDALKMLYAYMPLPDMTDRNVEYYLEYVVEPALQARTEMPWGSKMDDTLFRHFVLPVRVNNEALDHHRPQFYAELKERVKGLSMKDAILEVNHWCHEKVTYQPSDGRTHSPLQSISSAIGRCGEESTFTVAALRSVGIPARQVYTPRWAHTDDNHAWVEAWADGKWHFLGACEPEPVLDLGWFNAPASRGMLMHARVFGNYAGSEERLEKIDGITFINVTDNYAPVDTVTLEAVYPDGRRATGAKASFRLYNYAEFYPIAEKITDAQGEASLVAGLGDLLLWVTDGENFGYRKASVGKDRRVRVTLDKTGASPISEDLDITPPTGRTSEVAVPDAERARNNERLQTEDAIRNAYMATFFTDSLSEALADRLGLDKGAIQKVMKDSRGNHQVIEDFLTSLTETDRNKGLILLQSLTEKDLTDVTPEVLADHITATDYGSGDFFGAYVMSPRIASEELTPFRSFFLKTIPEKTRNEYRKNPGKWMKWVGENIATSEIWYPEQIAMSPEAVWRNRSTSTKSRDIFFVAGARSCGIPARVNPVTEKPQWADTYGNWHDADFESKNPTGNASAKGVLKLDYDLSAIVTDPKYYSHFSVSAISDGEPALLNYPDFIPLSETFAKGEELAPGTYLTVTGQRMADGGVLAHIQGIVLDGDTVTAPLTVRHDDSKVQVIGSFDSETRYLPDGATSETSILSTTGRGYYVLALLKPNHEPSNHVIRDLAEAAAELEATGLPILLLTEDSGEKGFGIETGDFPQLPSNAAFGSDIDRRCLRGVAEGLGLDSADLPVLIVADTFNRIVYVSQGYTIGIGEKLAALMRRL